MLMLLGAIGTASAPTASAGPGDACGIAGPTIIEVGSTHNYTAVFEDWDGDLDVNVDLDDEEGDSDITSVDQNGDGDSTDTGETVNDTDHLIAEALGDTDCAAVGLLADITALLGDGLENGEVCWAEDPVDDASDTDDFGTGDASDCQAAAPGEGGESMWDDGVNDDDIDCGYVPTGGGLCTISGEAVAFAADFLAAELGADGDCDDIDAIGLALQTALLLEGLTTEFVAFQFHDFIQDNCGSLDFGGDDDSLTVDVTCDRAGNFTLSFAPQGDSNEAISIEVTCRGIPASATLVPFPTTVESNPALGNISHSLLVLTIVDSAGNPVFPDNDVDWSTDRCTIRGAAGADYEGASGLSALFGAYKSSAPATAAAIEGSLAGHGPPPFNTSNSATFLNDPAGPPPIRSIGVAVLHCEGAAPGVANVTADIEIAGADIRVSAAVTVVGPPAFITMTAAPSKLVCGEKATVLVTVTDAINQKVSDHERVELITNYGGVLGGTGATLAFPGVNPVGPLSSGAAETFGGVATAYLLTSSSHVGAYEVVAAAGGSNVGAYSVAWTWGSGSGTYLGNTGVFSTPVVSSQVTVTCTAGAPAVTAPATGTGTISPPNTGDAGLAATSSGSTTLYVIFGAVAFVLAGLVSFGNARR